MAENTKIWYLKNFNLLKELRKDILEELDRKTSMRTSSKKSFIYFPDEPANRIYFLKKGKIKITRVSEDGRITTIDLLGPGEIFGETAILEQSSRNNFAEVVEDAVICSVDADLMKEMMFRFPELGKKINKFIGMKLRRIEVHLEDLVFKTAEERIKAFLVRYASDFGSKVVEGVMVRPFLTHKEIAELTATSRQTVSTLLNQLEKSGKIGYSRRFLLLKTTEL